MSRIPTTYDRIYEIVRQIPQGRVATYGQVAELSNLAGKARVVGYALYRSICKLQTSLGSVWSTRRGRFHSRLCALVLTICSDRYLKTKELVLMMQIKSICENIYGNQLICKFFVKRVAL